MRLCPCRSWPLASIFLFLLIPRGLAALEIVVDPAGSGNYLTIQTAVNAALPGDTIAIRAGTYLESVQLLRSGTAEAPITLRPFGDGEAIIDGQGGRAEACMLAEGVSHLRIEGLTLRGASIAGFYAEGPADGITLDGLTIEDIIHPDRAVGYGIYFYALPGDISNTIIRGCVIRHTSSHGIFLYGRNRRAAVRDCRISFSGFQEGAWGHAVKTVVWDEDGPQNGPTEITIEDNEVDNAWTQGIMTWNAGQVLIRGNTIHHCGATGVQIENGTTGFVVEDNLVEWNQQRYSTETGIWVDDASCGIVRNNLIRHNQVGIKVGKSDRIIVRHNVILDCRRENPDYGDNGGIYLLAYDWIDDRDTIVAHNTIHGTGMPGLMNSGLLISETGSARVRGSLLVNNIVSGVDDGYEYLWLGGDPVTNFNTVFNPDGIRIYRDGKNMTWDAYRAASGQDADSIALDPLFTSAETGDFSLQVGSPAVDAGTPLTRTASPGQGTAMEVEDSRPFTDGFGLVEGDEILVGGRAVARIVGIDPAGRILTLDRKLAWDAGAAVSLPYRGQAPDMGAIESLAHQRPLSPP